MFSPHTRGCSDPHQLITTKNLVFPAYAGMFRRHANVLPQETCFPRIRGDVPVRPQILNNPEAFSPHTRGCSAPTMPPIMAAIVFPAYAGMFLLSTGFGKKGERFSPHTRGCSDQLLPMIEHGRVSPHTRGCSESTWFRNRTGSVFPAYAGMFLETQNPQVQREGFPRIRGDVPVLNGEQSGAKSFSPHTRGCSPFELC